MRPSRFLLDAVASRLADIDSRRTWGEVMEVLRFCRKCRHFDGKCCDIFAGCDSGDRFVTMLLKKAWRCRYWVS
jgi:hypothetical protein